MNDKKFLEVSMELITCFPNSFVNGQGEFIADKKTNAYFDLKSCKNEKEVKCKVLEYFSRDAYKSEPFESDVANENYHAKMLNGINAFLGTKFNKKDIEIIYTYLGNGVNRKKTLELIDNKYVLTKTLV